MSTRAVITIRYQEPPDIPWTAKADLVEGHPYTYSTDGLLVTVDWEHQPMALPTGYDVFSAETFEAVAALERRKG